MSARPRAIVVVTGSELVRGERPDLNGPFLAAELVRLGFDVGRITIVGDHPTELAGAVEEALTADVCIFSGGLGPTHDDRTIEALAAAAGRALRVDPSLEQEIEAVSRQHAARLGRPYADFAAGVRKQASLPDGAISLGLAGTAPGVALPLGGHVAVALPGPPGELRRLWPAVTASEPFARLLERIRPRQHRVLRFYGPSESTVARAFDEAGGDGDGVETTICARDFEIHVELLVETGGEARAAAIERELRARFSTALFTEGDRPVEDIVLALARARGSTVATAESCTGGLVAARLTSVAGSSDVFVGGIVAYSNAVKESQLGVPAGVIERFGAVSAEAAKAMASGVRRHLDADIAAAVTGVAGPSGGSDEKPVGLVFVHVDAPGGDHALRLDLPGDRERIRGRATASVLHLLRDVLSQPGDAPA